MSTRGAFLACICGFTAASLACAGSQQLLVADPARVLQGFCGGALIPLVFSAIFLMFEGLGRGAGRPSSPALLAMLAPTLGPAVGGFVTDRYSWHWLFLINVPPGIVVALLVAWAVDIDRPDWRRLGSVDLWRSAAARGLSRQLATGSQGSPASRLGQHRDTVAGRLFAIFCAGWCDPALFAPSGAADRSVRISRPLILWSDAASALCLASASMGQPICCRCILASSAITTRWRSARS